MRALVFRHSVARQIITKAFSYASPRALVGPLAPMQLEEIPEPHLPADDCPPIRTRLCGIRDGDTEQVFLNGAMDDRMTSLISLPQVLGHEVVGVVEAIGTRVARRRVGERVVLEPWYGMPMLNGGVDVVYDTVGLPETREVSVRITRPRGAIVVTGVEVPRRFEWIPLYLEEIALIGSNAFAEEDFEGTRKHAVEIYFDCCSRGAST